jgi:NAD(P)-dependent dehydrogenase (short-subunit alcohol dehydrogenase family)
MDLQIKDKTALVTGGTGGIGLAAAQALAAEGARVFITGRDSARLAEAVAAIGPQAQGLLGDAATAAGAGAIIAALPKVDILVNNLGIYESRAFTEITDEGWMAMLETNVLSGVRLSRHYLPAMLADSWGRIIFVSSDPLWRRPRT